MPVLQQLLNLFCFHSLLINDCHFFDLFKVLPLLWILPALWIMRQVYWSVVVSCVWSCFFLSFQFLLLLLRSFSLKFDPPFILWISDFLQYVLDYVFGPCFETLPLDCVWTLFTDKCISLSIQPLSWHHRKSHHKWMGKKIQIYCICHGAKQMTAQNITTIKSSMVHSGVLWQLWSPTSALLT